MKLTEVPRTCEACDQPYPAAIRLERKLQKKAVFLLTIGIVATIAWTAFLAVVVWNMLRPGVYVIPVRGPAVLVFLPAVILACVPGVIIGAWAYSLPKVVRRECFHCRAKHEYVVDNRG